MCSAAVKLSQFFNEVESIIVWLSSWVCVSVITVLLDRSKVFATPSTTRSCYRCRSHRACRSNKTRTSARKRVFPLWFTREHRRVCSFFMLSSSRPIYPLRALRSSRAFGYSKSSQRENLREQTIDASKTAQTRSPVEVMCSNNYLSPFRIERRKSRSLVFPRSSSSAD